MGKRPIKVFFIRDYHPRAPKAPPAEPATVLILPVIRIERYEDRIARYDADCERAGFGRPMRPGFLQRSIEEGD